MTSFVAYHSFARTGHDYAARPSADFSFRSNKSRQFLERAVGKDVWVIEGRREASGRTQYALAARFTPDEVAETSGAYVVSGEQGEEYEPPLPLQGLAWFEELVAEQGGFSSGFGEIRSAAATAGLAALSSPPAAAVSSPDLPPPVESEATATVLPAASAGDAEPLPVALDSAGRVTGWLRQRRGRYYCHHCISRDTGVTPAQVNQVARTLEKKPREWRCSAAPCGACGRERKCIASVG